MPPDPPSIGMLYTLVCFGIKVEIMVFKCFLTDIHPTWLAPYFGVLFFTRSTVESLLAATSLILTTSNSFQFTKTANIIEVVQGAWQHHVYISLTRIRTHRHHFE